MNGRKFVKLTRLSSLLITPELHSGRESHARWLGKVFPRYSADMHVPDWNPESLSRFDAGRFIRLVAEGGAQSMMMANSHTGLCVGRTKIGRMHVNLQGRDFFGETQKAELDSCGDGEQKR